MKPEAALTMLALHILGIGLGISPPSSNMILLRSDACDIGKPECHKLIGEELSSDPPCRNISAWQRQEFIILGFTSARTGDRALGASYLGYREDGAIRYAGKAGTGFSVKEARELAAHFEKLATQKPSLTRGLALRDSVYGVDRGRSYSPSIFPGHP